MSASHFSWEKCGWTCDNLNWYIGLVGHPPMLTKPRVRLLLRKHVCSWAEQGKEPFAANAVFGAYLE